MIKIFHLRNDEQLVNKVSEFYASIWKTSKNDFYKRFSKHINNEGYRGYVALSDKNQVIGFIYGYKSLKGQYYRDLIEKELSKEEVKYWLTSCFELVELAIDKEYRRNGLGQNLTEKLLKEAKYNTTILSTQSKNLPAQQFYMNLNWIIIKENFYPTNDKLDSYVIMGKKLRTK